MQLPALTLRANAFLYVAKLLTGSMIVWFGLRAVGISEPYWAMISLIVVTEPDVVVAKKNFWARLINTVNGAIVACIALVLFGASFLSMMGAVLSGTGLSDEMRLAMYRVLEVMTGSTVALLQTVVYAYGLQRWKA